MMINWNVYWRLARFDKPVGILLLWFPTAWALWMANDGLPSFKLFSLFLLGTIIMRAVGCVVNDIADRDIDKHVVRTKLRPLTAGELNLKNSLYFLAILLSLALLILICLPLQCVYLALLALAITILYPFCKRWVNAPQMVLGLAFSLGIPMVYVASNVSMNENTIVLFLINYTWIVAYDTMYAMTDKHDDLQIGVKSTAIYFADYDRLIIGLLQLFFHTIWLYWGITKGLNIYFYTLWLAAGTVLIYQQKLIRKRIPQDCFKAFLISAYYGGIMWLALISHYR